MPIPSYELSCKFYYIHVDVCENRMTNIELVCLRWLQLLLLLFNISKYLLSKLFLELILFRLCLLTIGGGNYWLSLRRLIPISFSLALLIICGFWLVLSCVHSIDCGCDTLLLIYLLDVVRSVRIVMEAKKIEFRIVCLYFHDEVFKSRSILSYISCSLINYSLDLRRRDNDLLLLYGLILTLSVTWFAKIIFHHFIYSAHFT